MVGGRGKPRRRFREKKGFFDFFVAWFLRLGFSFWGGFEGEGVLRGGVEVEIQKGGGIQHQNGRFDSPPGG